jgi:hypothetical protein
MGFAPFHPSYVSERSDLFFDRINKIDRIERKDDQKNPVNPVNPA